MPLLSVVIPTRNRAALAVEAVASALRTGGEDLEVVVQDCSDTPSLSDLLEARGFRARVVYQWVQGPIPMTDNWNRALALASADYVTIIGDDDGILPTAANIARLASERECPAIAAEKRTSFWYPDFPDAKRAGHMEIPAYSGEFARVDDVEAVLRERVVTGDNYGALPMVYHGLVRRDLLEELRNRTGTYFAGLSPDIYSAFAVGLVCPWFIVLDYPFTIVGASRPSNSGRTALGTSIDHLREWETFEYSWLAPNSFMTYASNTDSMFRALENLDRLDLARLIDLRRVYARTIHKEPGQAIAHLQKYLRATRRLGRSELIAVAKLAVAVAGKIPSIGLAALRAHWGSREPPTRVKAATLSAAVAAQMEWLVERAIRLRL